MWTARFEFKIIEKFVLLEAIPIDFCFVFGFFCHIHLKCFYSTQRRLKNRSEHLHGSVRRWKLKSKLPVFDCIGVYFSSVLFCDCLICLVFFSVITNQAGKNKHKNSILLLFFLFCFLKKKPAPDAIHGRKRSFTDLNTVLMPPPDDVGLK